MIIVNVYPNAPMAAKAMHRYMSELYDRQMLISNIKPNMFVLDGNEHWYISETQYPMWCKGRTYMIDGDLYHSGYRIEKEVK